MRFNGFRDRRLRPLGHLSIAPVEPPTGGIVTSPASSSSACGEEVLKQFPCFVFTHARNHVAPVVEAFILSDVEEAPGSACFEICSGVDNTIDPGKDRCHRAHRARFESHNEGMS